MYRSLTLLPFLTLPFLFGGCELTNDFDSQLSCQSYCNKDFDCRDVDPSGTEHQNCMSDCRSSIEDDCGNDNQVAANDKINECVDKSCIDFRTCMVFEVAPECFGWVD